MKWSVGYLQCSSWGAAGSTRLPMAGIQAIAVHTSDFRPSRGVRYYPLTNQQLQGDLK